jgi:hypothetical protein
MKILQFPSSVNDASALIKWNRFKTNAQALAKIILQSLTRPAKLQ